MTKLKCKKYKFCERCEYLVIPQKSCADVMWVGLSSKISCAASDKICSPLDTRTNTGKVIAQIEEGFNNVIFYRTNLVKFPPINKDKKIRYPKTGEMKMCFPVLLQEIFKLKPKIVFLLGSKVSDFVLKKMKQNAFNKKDIKFMSVNHPSYIYIYRRKKMDNYVKEIRKIISNVCGI